MDPSAPFPIGAAVAPTIAAVDASAAVAPPSHPPYAEMISAAITALKERDGSSKRAIAKFIEEAYSGLPPTHSALLTHHLKRLKNSGLVVMVKKSYKIAPPRSENNGVAGDASSGPKRGRGRPPKPKPNSVQPVLAALGLVDEYTERKAPGRPRKSVSMAAVQGGAQSATVENGGSNGKRRPGRPMGQKPKSNITLNGPNGKRRPGRPSKAQSVPLIVPYATADIPKPRGRPKLVPGAAVNGGVKRRGRPPKDGGEVKIKKVTGKSPGRPRKNALTLSSDVELKKKLEYIQSKLMRVVGVLKPQLSHQSSISVVTAVEELEGLATLDISAPLPGEALAQVPVPVHQPLHHNVDAIW